MPDLDARDRPVDDLPEEPSVEPDEGDEPDTRLEGRNTDIKSQLRESVPSGANAEGIACDDFFPAQVNGQRGNHTTSPDEQLRRQPEERQKSPGIFNFIWRWSKAIREIFLSNPRKDTQEQDVKTPPLTVDPFFPASQNVFERNVSHLLKIWEFRRESFERAWAELQKNKYQIEAEYKHLRENPIILRFMEEYRRAGNDSAAKEAVVADLKKNLEDRYSEYAKALRASVANLERDIVQLNKCARIAFDTAGAEPLDRMGCPESVEKDVQRFLSGLKNRTDLDMVRDERGVSLHKKISDLGEEMTRMFAAFRKGESVVDVEDSAPGMRGA
jgi:hypothetical protein